MSSKFFLAGDVALLKTPQLRLSNELLNDISAADLACANLEGPETESQTATEKAGPSLKQPPGTIKQLAKSGFSYLSLANNHIMDYGQPGLLDTLATLKSSRLSASGAGQSLAAALAAAYLSIENTKVALLSLAELEFGGATDGHGGYAPLFGQRVDRAISQAKERADVVIVYTHGGLEEAPFPPEHIRARYRALIELGATLVVGSHPHVPQAIERYLNGLIFYSLGNFTIGFSDDRVGEWSLTAQVTIDAGRVKSLELKPIIRKDDVILYLQPDKIRACLAMLDQLGQLTASDQYHQAVACQAQYLFDSRYQHFLRSIFPDPAFPAHWLDRLTFKPTEPALKRHQELLLYLMLANDSHRTVLTEGLLGFIESSGAIKPAFDRFWRAVNNYHDC